MDPDTSVAGRDAAEVQRCEGGLDCLAQCEALSPLQELVGQASLLHDSQRRALLRLQEARARNNVAELASTKLWNLDGRIEAGTQLYVALQGGRTGAQGRAIVRRARQRAEGAIVLARQQLTEVQAAQDSRDKCLASLQQATGSLHVVRVVTEQLVLELATELEVRRTQLVGQLIGLRPGRRRHQQLTRQGAPIAARTID